MTEIEIEEFDENCVEGVQGKAQKAIQARLRGDLLRYCERMLGRDINDNDCAILQELVFGDPDSVDEVRNTPGILSALKDLAKNGSDAACETLISFEKYPLLVGKRGMIDEKSRVRPYFVHFRSMNISLLLHPLAPSYEVGEKPNFEVGFRLWGASLVLVKQLLEGCWDLTRKSVLEVGCGMGLCGLLAARLYRCSEVVLSDFHGGVVQNAQLNVDINDLRGSVATCVFDWEEDAFEDDEIMFPNKKYDCILGSDVVCQPQDCKSLAKVLGERLKSNGFAIICLGSATSRFGVEMFPQEITSCGLNVELLRTDAGNLEDSVKALGSVKLDHVIGRASGYNTYRVTNSST